MNAEFQRIARRDKVFLSDQCKEIEETTEWERLETSSRKSEIPREHFMQIWENKGQKCYGTKRRYLKEVARIHRRTIQKRSS